MTKEERVVNFPALDAREFALKAAEE